MQSLAVTAVIVLLLAIVGGPVTFLLSQSNPRGRSLFILHRVGTTILGFLSSLMSFTLMAAHLSIIIRLLGAIGLLSSVAGLIRLYRKRSRR